MLRKDTDGVSSVGYLGRKALVWFLGLVLATGHVSAGEPPGARDPASVTISAASPAANQLFADAAALYNRGRYAAAEAKFQLFLQRYRNDPLATHARHYVGVCWLNSGNLKKAAHQFAKVVGSSAAGEINQQSMIYFGWCLLMQGSAKKPELLEQAATVFQTHRNLYPQSDRFDESLFLHAKCLFGLGQLAEAGTLYRQVVEDHLASARRPDALFALARVERQLGRAEAAENYLRELIERYPEDSRAASIHWEAGEQAFANGAFETAEQRYEQVVEAQHPRADWALVKQAACQAKLKNNARAAELYARLPREFPHSELVPQAWLAAGHHFLCAENYDRAKECLRVIIDSKLPDSHKATHWLARCYLAEGKPSQTLELAQAALKSRPPDVVRYHLLLDRADALAAMPERSDDAFAAYAETFVEAPLPSVAGRALLGMLDFGRTDRQFKDIVEIAGEAAGHRPQAELVIAARVAVATAKMHLGRPHETAQLYGQLVADHPDHPHAKEWLVRAAWAMALNEEHQRAIDTLADHASHGNTIPLEAEIELIRGFSLARLGRLAEAIPPLQNVMRLAPDSPNCTDAMEALVRCYRLQGRWDDARRQAAELRQRNPGRAGSPALALDLAEIAYHLGDDQLAERHFESAIVNGADPDTLASCLHRLAWIQLRGSHVHAAIALFDRLIQEHSEHRLAQRALLERARCYQMSDRHEQAITDLWDFLESKPASTSLEAEAIFALGISFVHRHELADALSSFETVATHYPEFAGTDEALYQVGALSHHLDRDKAARSAFQRLTCEFPDSALAAAAEFHLGQLSYAAHQDQQAAEHFQAAIRMGDGQPLLSEAYYRLGWARFRSGDYSAARDAFQNQQARFPVTSFTHDGLFMLAESLLRTREWDRAHASYQLVVDHRQTTPGMQIVALLHGGQAAMESGHYKRAAGWLQRLVGKHPRSEYRVKAELQLGRCCLRQAKLDAAKDHLAWAAASGNSEVAAQATYELGQLYMGQQKFSQAIDQFAALVQWPDSEATEWTTRLQARAGLAAAECATVLAANAELEEEIGRLDDQATAYWQYVIDQHPDSAEAVTARERASVFFVQDADGLQR